jgi:hypothetical protein
MSTNPFEPPRTTDLEPAIGAARLVDAEAVRELTATAPWARRCARLATVIAVACTVNAGVVVATIKITGGARLLTSLFGVAAAMVFRSIFLGLARHAAAAATGDAPAFERALGAERAFFRMVGLVFLIGIAIGIVVGWLETP